MLEPGWLSTGPRVRQFEQAFAGRGALRAAMAIARLTEGR
jgi:dTDP-4-amino-4,6-dideoxygalactose transaminase